MIKGEKAGTALRTMFTNLAKPTKAMKNEMEKLGISITDSNGKMLPMRDVMDQLRGKFKGLSKDQQASAAATIFGKEAMSGALAVINASDEDYKKLTKSIDNSTGASERMSKEMEGGIGGSIRRMKSAIESMAISIGDVLAPHIRRAADFLAMLADKFTSMPGWIKTAIVGFGIFAAALGPLILTTGMFTAALGSIMTTIGPVMTGITKAGGLMNFLGTKAPFAAKGLTLVGGAFKFMLGPVGLAIAAVFAIGTAFVVAYKKSETFRNIVHVVINPVVNAFKNLRNTAEVVFNALKNLFSGNALPTVDILSKIMPKETARKVTLKLMQIRQLFIDGFNEIWKFGEDIGRKLADFWRDNGATIMQAVTNIWNTIVTVFTEVKNFLWPILQELGGVVKTVFMNVIVPAVKIGMQIIWGVMKFLWPLIKTLIVDTWNNIKGIINGALDVILGIVKVFSGIFTGQWGQVWSGVKQIFSGALTLIWNLVQLWFIGKILKVVKIFAGMFKGVFSSAFNGVKLIVSTALKIVWSIVSTIFKRILSFSKTIFNGLWTFIKFVWNGIKNAISNTVRIIFNAVKRYFSAVKSTTSTIFNAVRTFVIKIWTNIKNLVSSIARSLWNSVRNIWNTLYSGTRGIFNKVKSWLSSLWGGIRSTVTRIASSLWTSVKRTWNNLWTGTRNIFNRVKRTLTDIWNGIKRSITGIASSLWSTVKRTFNNMSRGLKNIIGRIKSHINGMVNSVKKGLNKLIDGVNWVAGKIGMDPIDPIKLHTGTTHTHSMNYVTNGKVNRDTFATVGDKGKGNGPSGFRHEMIRYPNGKMAITPNRDTTAFLPKGSSVYNGAQTHAMLSRGTLPKFANGTMFDLLSDKKKPHMHKHGDDVPGDVMMKGAGGSVKAILGQAVDSGKAYVNKTLNAAAKGKDWLANAIGDVLDWIDKPGELLTKVLNGFGVNFDFLKGAEIPFKMMSAMFKKLKAATVKLFTSWLEDMGGGDGGYIDLSKGVNFGFHPTAASAAAAGYPFARPHYGLDINYKHDKVYSTLNGTATASYGWNGGFGNMVKIVSGALSAIYGHMHKLAFTGSKKVSPGTYLGISGGDPREDGQGAGSSTGLHLHYEMQKNGVPFDPTSWLKKNNGGGKSGGKKAASKWRPEIVRAARAMGVNPSNRQINGIIAQIQRESGGDAGITQSTAVRDINALTGNLAQGLLQYVPSTFRNFAVKGHTNIKSGYDQLLAFFNNSNWANDIQYGRSGWGPRGRRRFATGGLIKNAGWYNIAEGGYPEWIIPTDPARRSDAMKLLALAAQDIDNGKTTGNKRPGQLPRVNSNDNTALLLQMIENQQAQINVLMEIARSNSEIANKDFNPVIDEDAFERQHNRYQDKRERRERKSNMFRGGAFAT